MQPNEKHDAWNGKYTSDEFFHFVGWRHPLESKKNYEILSQVLTDQCISHKPHLKGGGEIRITINWDADFYKGELIDPTVTCYADIPRDCLGLHTKKYGQFGLSIDRRVLVYRGARPVTYMPYNPREVIQSTIHRGALINRLCKAIKNFERVVVEKLDHRPKGGPRDDSAPTYEETIAELSTVLTKDVLPFVKPFPLVSEDDPSNYYMEREWRMYGNLEFEPEWIRTIVVGSGYADKVRVDFPQYADRIYEMPALG